MRKRKRHPHSSDPDIVRIASRQGGGPEALLPVLRNVQQERSFLDKTSIIAAADELGVSHARAHGVATFYSMLATQPGEKETIYVCDGPVCKLRGAESARRAIDDATANQRVRIQRASCLGLCDRAPAALVGLDPCGPIQNSTASQISSGWRGDAPCYSSPLPGEVRVTMARIGKVDPDDIHSAIELGAYESLKASLQRSPLEIISDVTDSGLTGRGGAGFPTGRKWRSVADENSSRKFVICNADESEPTAFKDRVLLEGDPHSLLEGMALAALGVGAAEGVVYIRGEYESAARRLENAVGQAEQAGWLGNNIQGTDFSFSVSVHRGAGAYICGEESALLESLQGRRGEPRLRPPYPTTDGLLGKPTLVNNVETFCTVPNILSRGPSWFRSLGPSDSPGTKLFAVTGCVNRPGVFESPMGITLRQVIDQFAGGLRDGSEFRMALTGGAAGTIVGASALDAPIDSDARRYGPSLGTGSVLVLDQSVSACQLLEWLLQFFEYESCGKCTPCREGVPVARGILRQLRTAGAAQGDIQRLSELSEVLSTTSLCGLGRSVAWPIDSAVRNFPEEFQCKKDTDPGKNTDD